MPEEKWLTVSEASNILGVTERTIWRWVSENKCEAKIEDNKRFVKVEIPTDKIDDNILSLSDKDQLINWFKVELNYKNKQIEQLQTEIRLNNEKTGVILTTIMDELKAQNQILEYIQAKIKQDESFWKRIRRKNSND